MCDRCNVCSDYWMWGDVVMSDDSGYTFKTLRILNKGTEDESEEYQVFYNGELESQGIVRLDFIREYNQAILDRLDRKK